MTCRPLGAVATVAVLFAVGAMAGAPAARAQAQPTPCADGGVLAAAEYSAHGDTAWRRGDAQEAALCFAAAARRGGSGAFEAWLRAGRAYQRSGQPQRALEAFGAAAESADAGVRARASLGRAPVLLALGEPDAAMGALDAALNDAPDGDPGLRAAIENNRGGLLLEQGDLAGAGTAYDAAEARAREDGRDALALSAGANGLRVAVQRGDPAGPLLDRADDLTGELATADAPLRLRLSLHLGRTLQELSGRDRAAGRRAAALLLEAEGLADELGDERARSFALGYLAELYAARGREADALELSARATLAARRADAPHALYRWQRQRATLLASAGQLGEAIASLRGAKSSLDRIRAESAPLYGPGSRWFTEAVEPVHFELVDLLLQRAAAEDDTGREQLLLAESRDTLEDLKAAELRDYFQDECVDAQRRASVESIEGALVVYPVMLADRLELIVSDGARLHRVASPVSRDDLVAEVRAFRRLLEKRTTHEYRVHARALYGWIVAPVVPLLRPDLEALVFVPGGALRTIPFGALMDPATGRFLVEDLPVAVAPGMTLTDPRRIPNEDLEVLSAGLSEGRQGFAPLENVDREIDAVRDVFPESRELVGERFVRSNLEDEIEERRPGIVHIASHAAFRDDLSESFVLTYDDRIRWEEMGEMLEVARFRDRPVELITLSACETAMGDDRGALGLAGITVRAGARSALATLWAVDDRSSADLTGEFYRQLATSEQTRAEALRAAQRKVLGEHRYRHPGYWAPYLLVGSWL